MRACAIIYKLRKKTSSFFSNHSNGKQVVVAYMITDMTVGSPRRILFRFCLPMLASVAFQQFYGMVDSIVVG